MRRFSDRHSLTTVSELNITPLLDLAFVLLIIFMITTPLMEGQVDLILPSGQAAPKSIDPADLQTVAIYEDERVELNGAPVELEQLTVQLQEVRARIPAAAVVVRSDRQLPVQRLVTVMEAVQRSGITKIGVLTLPEQP